MTKQQWVKYDEQQPTEAGEYLTCIFGHIEVLYFDGNTFIEYRLGSISDCDDEWGEYQCDISPDYWMPLPEIPVEKEVQ